jgi:prepilin-type N-terminal cleavage/methylation domain-containing protein
MTPSDVPFHTATPEPRRDCGVSLIEILITIVILGVVGSAVLTGLRTTIIGSAVERDHARAHQWLQSATEVLVNDVPWEDCDPADSAASAATLQASYQTQLQANSAIVPAKWKGFQIVVPDLVEFAGASGAYGATCLETEDRQRITIQVRAPDYKIIETVEVVKVP